MGAAHAETIARSWPYARHYVHAGMLGYEGHKMSKSRGNLVFVSAARAAGHDPNVIRLALMDHHYREDWEWHDTDFGVAKDRLETWRHAALSGCTTSADELVSRMRVHLADDLDTPSALRAIDWWAQQSQAHRPGDSNDGRIAGAAIEALLGIDVTTS